MGQRGNLLGFAVALMLIMLTLVSALHHYQGVSRRATQSADAQLRMVCERQWELARLLNKVPSGARMPTDYQVSANLAVANSTTTIAVNSSAKLFQTDGNGVWNGLPNVLVTRGASNITVPPGYRGVQGKPTVTNPAYDIFPKSYRAVVTDLSPYAAYAPNGNVTLKEVVGWANPPLGEEKPLELYSGVPATVAAGRNLNIGNLTYGTAYSGNLSGTTSPAVNISQGLVMPRMVGRNFPGKGFDVTLADEIYDAAGELTDTAQALGDKTRYIDGSAPTASRILGDLFAGRAPDFASMIGLKAALNFPCPVLPGLSTTAVPMTYVALQFWFHAPFPPDGTSGSGNPFDAIQSKIDEVDAWRKERGEHERRIRQLKGGTPPSETRIHEGLRNRKPGFQTSDYPLQLSEPGLIQRFEDDILPKLKADLTKIDTESAGGRRTKMAGNELKTDETFLQWMADFGPRGRLYPPGTDGSASKIPTNVFEQMSSGQVQPAEVYTPYNLIAERTWGNYEKYPNPYPDNPSLADKVRPDKDPVPFTNLNSTGTTAQPRAGRALDWDVILPGLLSDLGTQAKLYRLLTDTGNKANPYYKAKQWLADSERRLAELDTNIAAKEKEIDDYLKSFDTGTSVTAYPQTRAEDATDSQSNDKGMACPPYCHSRFGYSFDIFYYLIESAIDGNLKSSWQPSWPLVFYGTQDTRLNGAISAAGYLNIKSTVVIPQNRTFYYDNKLVIRGDLWLQRGSTMYVNQNLEMQAPGATDPDRYNWFTPCGRIILEEGATLMVDGEIYGAGTPERGSVVVTTQGDALHPINAAIICDGNVTLPYGVYTGYTLGDVLCLKQLGSVGQGVYKNAAGPLLNFVAPNMGKIWGPFHTRKPFFPRMATEYQFEVWIGPFGIPIPTVHPWLATRKNIWVPLYKAFSFFYTVSNNLVLGENLYPQADWWPFGQLDGVGRVPIVPKLDPSAVKTLVKTITTVIPTTPAEVASKFRDFLNNFWKNELLTVIKQQVIGTVVGSLALGNVPFAGDIFSGIVNDALSALGASQADLEAGKNGPGDLQTEVTNALKKPFNEILDAWEKLKSETLADALAHEVAGIIIEGDGIRIGMTKAGSLVSPRPFMCSGLIVSLNDVTLNVDRFVGSVSSRQGSIKGVDCRLLYYPLFTRASLYQPNRYPTIQRQSPLNALSGVIQRAINWEYGVMCSPGSGIDVGTSGTSQTVTAEGWE